MISFRRRDHDPRAGLGQRPGERGLGLFVVCSVEQPLRNAGVQGYSPLLLP